MVGIRVTIDRFTDEHFPGWVACSFIDAAGALHLFEEKVPVVTEENLRAESDYPREGIIGCEVISSRCEADGRELVLVDTEKPWGIESKAGTTRFEVNRNQILEFNGAG
jgi:hypothetical protein